MSRYKVGDVVLVKFVIRKVDVANKERCPYNGTAGGAMTGMWFSDNEVFAVVAHAEPEPVKPEPLKVGEFVRDKAGDVGQVVKRGEKMVIALIPDGSTRPAFMCDLIRIPRPADWPF
jgi:hypothetical protein